MRQQNITFPRVPDSEKLMRTQQSYSGYYKNIWIRSSYEYALIKYFEYYDIKYEYEPYLFTFKDGTTYKPDFFVGSLFYEVKNEASRKIGEAHLSKMQLEHGIQGVVVTYKVLQSLYTGLPLRLNQVINEWKNSPETKLNSPASGERNPRYGTKHSDKTKHLISTKAKARMQDPEYRSLMWERSWCHTGETAKRSLTGRIKVERVEAECPECRINFYRAPHRKSIFCSNICAQSARAKLGAQAEIRAMHLRLKIIIELTSEWLTENYQCVLDASFNKINAALEGLSTLCAERVGVKDYRTIAKAFNAKNAKELLAVLKQLAENVRRAKDESTSYYAEKSLELEDKKPLG